MNRLLRSLLVGGCTLGALIPAVGVGQAVSVDATSLMRRLDSIEQRLRESEGHRGGALSAGRSAVAPVTAGGGTGYAVADLTTRMEDLEREVAQTKGGNERVMFAIEKLAKRFDDYTRDMDMRLNDLEAKMARVPAAGVPVSAVAATPAAAGAAVVATSPVMRVASATTAAVPAAAAATVSATAVKKTTDVIPAGLTPTDLYNKAYAYLTATDYANAEAWLNEFLKRHPKDKLADNAWYWLGETQLVQNNPAAAVVSFRNGLKNFPQGAKAPANLFKMGLALEQLNQPELAKGAWQKLIRDYPKSTEALRAKEKMAVVKPAA